MNSEDKTKIMNNQEKGITLVVLVITIVVMCILTGVTVHQTISENGLFHSITEIGRKSKNEQEEAAESTEEEIKDKLDTAEGVKDNKVANSIELACIEKWSDYITVQLNIGSYNFEGGEYGIENIKYAIKKTGEKKYSNYKIGTEGEYICKFDDLAEGTEYTIGAFAEYKDDNGKTAITENPIAESSAITTFKFKFKIGDWVDYDAGTWTQAEIDNLKTLGIYYDTANLNTYSDKINDDEIPSSLIVNQFSGMSAGTSKNGSESYTKTGFSGKESDWSLNKYKKSSVTSGLTGWRVLGVNDKGQVELVSAGIPEYYLGRACYVKIGLRVDRTDIYSISKYYVEENTLVSINKRNFLEYINKTYANNARMMTYNDINSMHKDAPSDLKNIGGAAYIQNTVKQGKTKIYATIKEAYNKGIYGSNYEKSYVTIYTTDFINPGTSGEVLYSAGMLGVRVVVTLKDGYIPHNKKEGETAEKTGKSYSDRLYIVTKDEFEKLG